MEVELLVGIIGVAGTLAGVLISQWIERHNEERRWAREERTRFHAERRAAYVKFLALAQDLYLDVAGKAKLRAEGDTSALPLDEYAFITQAVPAELKSAYEEVHLLGTPKVRVAARALNDCLPALVRAAYSPDWQTELSNLAARIVAARDQLHLAAREELGIEGSQTGPASAPIGHAAPIKLEGKEAPQKFQRSLSPDSRRT